MLQDDKRGSLQSFKDSECYASQKSHGDSTVRLLLSILTRSPPQSGFGYARCGVQKLTS